MDGFFGLVSSPLRCDVLWLRLWKNGPGLQLKGPSSIAPYSERSGRKKPVISAFGWRLFYLKPFRPVTC